MLGTLSAMLFSIIEKLSFSAIDRISEKLSRRSSLASKLVALYSSLSEVEEQSERLFSILRDIVAGNERKSEIAGTLLGRIDVRETIQSLRIAVQEFSNRLSEVKRAVGILSDDELHRALQGMQHAKLSFIEAVDLLILATPEFRESKDLSTGYLTVPTSDWDLSRIKAIEAEMQLKLDSERRSQLPKPLGLGETRAGDTGDIGQLRDSAVHRLDQLLRKKEFDIHDSNELQCMLSGFEEDIAEIRRARKKLGSLIKAHVSFEELLS